jgi:hypothetical protein
LFIGLDDVPDCTMATHGANAERVIKVDGRLLVGGPEVIVVRSQTVKQSANPAKCGMQIARMHIQDHRHLPPVSMTLGHQIYSDRKLICPAEELLPLSSEGTLIALAGRRHRPMASARSSGTLPARYSSSAFAPRGLD